MTSSSESSDSDPFLRTSFQTSAALFASSSNLLSGLCCFTTIWATFERKLIKNVDK